MLIKDSFHQTPFGESLLADHILACIAEIIDLSMVRAADRAEVCEMNVDDEVRRDDLAFVLADVLWAQFHLACFDVVAPLDECSVKHHAEHRFTREACVLEDDFNVSLKNQTLLLFFGQKKDDTILCRAVASLRRVSKNSSDIEAPTPVDFKKRRTLIA